MVDKKQKKKRWGSGRVSFLACIDKITEDVLKGLPIKHLHEKYQSKIDISYSQFARLVNNYILHKPNKVHESIQKETKEEKKELVKTEKIEKKKDACTRPISKFEFDPTDPKDLI